MAERHDIVIYLDPTGQPQAVLLVAGQPVEWLRPPAPGALLRQDILLGRVRQLVPALKAAFIDIGQPHDALLPLGQAPADLKPGQSILVQVRRLAAEGKGHPVTCRPQLPGAFAVLDIARTRPLRRSKLAAFAGDEQERLFAADLHHLEQLWQQLQAEAAGGGPVPRLLARFGDPLPLALTSWPDPRLKSIQVEGSELFAQVDDLVQKTVPHLRPLLRIHPEQGGYNLAAVHRLTDLEEQVRQRRVWLSNGAYLVFDQTEALLVIDVNSGKASNAPNPDQLHRQTNLLAAAMIARQLRLRNISGLVVVDFIRLNHKADQAECLAAFTAALAEDRGRVELGGYTKLGLVELIRNAP
jgi:Ribonuclease G/E